MRLEMRGGSALLLLQSPSIQRICANTKGDNFSPAVRGISTLIYVHVFIFPDPEVELLIFIALPIVLLLLEREGPATGRKNPRWV